jgi:integrase
MPDRQGRRNPRQIRSDLTDAVERLQSGASTSEEADQVAREAGHELAEIKRQLPAGRRNPRPPARKIRLTKSAVAALPLPPEGKPYSVAWDTEESGFGVRVMRSGRRVYFWQGRVRESGRAVKVTIGNAAKVTAEQARQRAKLVAAQADLGDDPAEARKAARQERRERQPEHTVAALWREYCQRHLPKKRASSQAADHRLWRLHVEPALGGRKVAALTSEDLEDLHRDVTCDHGPYAANRVLALVSTMLALAVKARWRLDNPARGVGRNPEAGRERFLTPEEIARLLAVLEAQGDLAAKCLEFLLLTGCRRGEALGATWDQFDLSAGVWTKPPSLTKSGKRHRVPLSPEAIALLAGLPTRATAAGPFVGLPVWQLTRRWFAIRKEAGLADVRLHDLRHSFASLLASSGLSLPVIGALLGHSQASTTQRYAHLLDDALRDAAAKVGAAVRRNGDNVVKMPPKRGAS